MRAFFFFVFFDMGSQVSGAAVWFLAGRLPGRAAMSMGRTLADLGAGDFVVEQLPRLAKRKTWTINGTMKM